MVLVSLNYLSVKQIWEKNPVWARTRVLVWRSLTPSSSRPMWDGGNKHHHHGDDDAAQRRVASLACQHTAHRAILKTSNQKIHFINWLHYCIAVSFFGINLVSLIKSMNCHNEGKREHSRMTLNGFLVFFTYTANPFPVMTTGISLCSNSHREFPVMNTGSLQWEHAFPVM